MKKKTRNGEWRWNDLSEEEKRVCRLSVVDGMKKAAIASEIGVSHTQIKLHFRIIYRVLKVKSLVELAFEMGRHWMSAAPPVSKSRSAGE